MNQLNSIIEQCEAVWEDWNDQGVAGRVALLQRWSDTVSARGEAFADAAKMIRFQCDNAERLLDKVHELPGPTGETNELYTVGRGTFAITGDASLTHVALCGQLAAALVAGNCVVVSVEGTHTDMVDAVLADLVKAGCPDRVAIRVDLDTNAPLLAHPNIVGLATTGTLTHVRDANRQLAQRQGVIAALVAESDTQLYPVIGAPDYVLRFVTERTRTINITAVGGNATLLELGSGEH
ncbi:aldehyde dehydrogenase family protein [Salinivibrio sp. SS2]|uniref:aldehyde dehydrogenase family protein n=1 Tax=Salinivibrio sp. SS2 TaxID=1892894 RepID=UPI00084CE490|nr:aldehyde dehydrogenase family protein [Salinivibrio sp. DV]ODQ01534.1 delta 1-pyrroline-5-carboxylate dehydrogenase [Salinivibrio sp. DV]